MINKKINLIAIAAIFLSASTSAFSELLPEDLVQLSKFLNSGVDLDELGKKIETNLQEAIKNNHEQEITEWIRNQKREKIIRNNSKIKDLITVLKNLREVLEERKKNGILLDQQQLNANDLHNQDGENVEDEVIVVVQPDLILETFSESSDANQYGPNREEEQIVESASDHEQKCDDQSDIAKSDNVSDDVESNIANMGSRQSLDNLDSANSSSESSSDSNEVYCIGSDDLSSDYDDVESNVANMGSRQSLDNLESDNSSSDSNEVYCIGSDDLSSDYDDVESNVANMDSRQSLDDLDSANSSSQSSSDTVESNSISSCDDSISQVFSSSPSLADGVHSVINSESSVGESPQFSRNDSDQRSECDLDESRVFLSDDIDNTYRNPTYNSFVKGVLPESEVCETEDSDFLGHRFQEAYNLMHPLALKKANDRERIIKMLQIFAEEVAKEDVNLENLKALYKKEGYIARSRKNQVVLEAFKKLYDLLKK